MATIGIRVPDLGSVGDVPVIEVLAKVGDAIAKDQGLVTLESDKATMEVPSNVAGTLRELKVKVGDVVGSGAVVALVDAVEARAGGPTPAPATKQPSTPAAAATAAAPAAPAATAPAEGSLKAHGDKVLGPRPAAASGRQADAECQVLVLGAGPGGYTAAFRAADLGLDTLLVERYPELGGVCLNVGCIPSKALLHAARVIDEAAHFGALGITFGAPRIELDKLRAYKDGVVAKLTGGLAGMSKQRKVARLTGAGKFLSPNELEVAGADGTKLVRFGRAIIAVGSRVVKLPGLPWGDPRLMDSTDALDLADVPKRLLEIGGGIIGLEMACVYAALGSEVTVVELMDQLMPGADPDLVRPLQ